MGYVMTALIVGALLVLLVHHVQDSKKPQAGTPTPKAPRDIAPN